jgi:hypothetical protein
MHLCLDRVEFLTSLNNLSVWDIFRLRWVWECV